MPMIFILLQIKAEPHLAKTTRSIFLLYSNLHSLHCMLSRYWSSWIQNNLVRVQPPIFLAVILREIKTGLQLRIQSCNSLQTSMIFIVLQVKSNVSPTSTLPRTKSLPGVRSADRGRAGPSRPTTPARRVISRHWSSGTTSSRIDFDSRLRRGWRPPPLGARPRGAVPSDLHKLIP